MSTDKEVVLKGAFDASGVKQGVQEATTEIGKLGPAAAKAGADAGRGFAPIGDGAEGAGQKVDRETRRMVQAIQRATAAAESGGRATAGYFEAIAAQRGVNAETLRPYLDGLRRVEQAQAQARQGLDGMGVSAAQTAAALRQVPAQFTDIATSLASGQSPLTVLLQQGGQLKDQFGGAGAAAQALGGYVASLINPLTVAAGVAGVLAFGFFNGAKEAQEFERALVLSGNAAGTTADQLADVAAALDGIVGTQAKAADVLTVLASTGEVGAGNMQRFAQAIIELERAGGPAAEKTAEAFAELGRKPLEAILKLNEAQRFLTRETFEQIKALQDAGRETEAARVAQEAYAAAIEQRIPQLEGRLGILERAWIGIKDATKEAGDAILSIGRSNTVQQEIDKLTRARDALLAPGSGFGGTDESNARELALIDARLSALRATQQTQEASAKAAAERARQEEAAIKWLRDGEQFLTSQQRLEREIARVRAEGATAKLSEAEIEARIAAIRERAAKPDRAAASEAQRFLENLQRQVITTQELTSVERALAEIQSGRLGTVTARQREAILAAAGEIDAAKKAKEVREALAKAAEAEAKALADAVKAREQYIQGLDRSIEAGERALDQLRDELIGLTAGRDVVRERVLARLEEQAAALEMQAIRAADRQLDDQEAQRLRERARQLRDEIVLRRGIAKATDDAEVAQAEQRSADRMAAEYQRASDQISQSLTDAIMQGGQKGGELLRNYFRTLILRPIVDAIVRPIAGAITGALGLPSAALAASGGPGGSALTAAGPLAGLAGLGGTFAGGAQFVLAGGSLGSSLSASSALIGSGQVGTGLALGAGSLAAYGGGALAGIYGGRAISNGFAAGGSGNSAINVGTAIGAAIAGPIGAAIGGLLGGATNRLFGRRLEQTGIEGTFTTDGFSGNSFEFFRGGTFRSDKTKTSPLDESLGDALTTGAQAVSAQVREYARVLGLPVSAIEGFSQSIKLNLRGLSQEQATEAITKAVEDFQEGIAKRFEGQIASLKRGTETFSQALARLTGLELFSQSINNLGGVFTRVARLSFDAREELIGLAGGLDQFNQKALNFVQGYFERDEIAGIRARDVQTALLELGVGQPVNSRADFRALVESTDVTTEVGRRQLNALLDLAGPAGEVFDYLAETGRTLLDVARQAPSSPLLGDALQTPDGSREQVTAINRVGDNTGRMVDLLDRLLQEVRDGRTRLGVPTQPEAQLAL